MQVYVITSHQRYEGSIMLKISSSLDKALQHLKEIVTSDNKYPDLWVEENLETYNYKNSCSYIYRDVESSDIHYSIRVHTVD